MLLAVDTARIRRATGWAPRLTLEDALSDLIVAYGLQPTPVHAGGADRQAGE